MERTTLFRNRSPEPEQADTLNDITALFVDAATRLEDLLDDGRCKSVAFTKLEEASMWAKKSVLFDGEPT